jgi:hypothetical protein
MFFLDLGDRGGGHLVPGPVEEHSARIAPEIPRSELGHVLEVVVPLVAGLVDALREPERRVTARELRHRLVGHRLSEALFESAQRRVELPQGAAAQDLVAPPGVHELVGEQLVGDVVSDVDCVGGGKEGGRSRVPQVADQADRVARGGRPVKVAEDGEHLIQEAGQRRGLLGRPARRLPSVGGVSGRGDREGDLVPGVSVGPRRGHHGAAARHGAGQAGAVRRADAEEIRLSLRQREIDLRHSSEAVRLPPPQVGFGFRCGPRPPAKA